MLPRTHAPTHPRTHAPTYPQTCARTCTQLHTRRYVHSHLTRPWHGDERNPHLFSHETRKLAGSRRTAISSRAASLISRCLPGAWVCSNREPQLFFVDADSNHVPCLVLSTTARVSARKFAGPSAWPSNWPGQILTQHNIQDVQYGAVFLPRTAVLTTSGLVFWHSGRQGCVTASESGEAALLLSSSQRHCTEVPAQLLRCELIDGPVPSLGAVLAALGSFQA